MNYFDFFEKFQDSENKELMGKVLQFNGVENFDTYNPALIIENEKKYLAVRVESRVSDWLNPLTYDSKIMFFQENGDAWNRVDFSPIFRDAEDPFAKWIDSDGQKTLIFGFVSTFQLEHEYTIGTHLLADTTVLRLDHGRDCFAEILEMKDIRFVQLPDKRFVVCPRPQGAIGNRGRASMLVVNSLKDLNYDSAWSAPILDHQVDQETWIGNNEMFYLENGKVGTLGHVATITDGYNRHYAAAVWEIDFENFTTTRPKIIATRDNFPKDGAKKEILSDVVFPGGFELLDDNRVRLFAGLSDSDVGVIELPNPFTAPILY